MIEAYAAAEAAAGEDFEARYRALVERWERRR